MARKLCTICHLRPVGTGSNAGYEDQSFCQAQGFCNPCGNEAQHEISHDNGHDWVPTDKCWICHPEMNQAAADYVPRQGHTNTVAKTRTSHAGCDHARTPKARAVCRRGRATGRVVTLIEAPEKPVKAARVTDVASLPMPKLTASQLASPIIQSMMRR